LNAETLHDFGSSYAAAWCSGIAASVAAFYEDNGSLQINGGPPSEGRVAISAAAQAFMTAFPGMIVSMDDVCMRGSEAIFRWTLAGTNTGPGGTGRSVRISGYEEWQFGKTGLIERSKGHFDEADYQRQLNVV
jgi:hypothetical protein